ncbi:MAG: phosphoribosyl-AMP cyclohydrolase [Endomicrobiaceae bacterium]|nr:phosphoribosyl-AMP cyclohydrolase [Endomicrobiaceae bacterium]
MLEITKQLKFDKNGLIPAVVQDYNDGAVLMVAYMNAESFERTLKTKKATYWSRSRQKFWVKGEESGNIQKVKEIYYDCDADCILLKVIQVGGSACHTGYRSCFYRKLSFTGNTRIVGKKVFDPKKYTGNRNFYKAKI